MLATKPPYIWGMSVEPIAEGVQVDSSRSDSELRLTRVGTDEEIRSRFDDPIPPEASDRARHQVLKAITFSLAHRPFSTLSRGIAPSEWRIDGFRSRFYRQFDAKSDAVLEILRAAIRPDRSELTDGLVAQMSDIAAKTDDAEGETDDETRPSDFVAALGNAYFSQSVGDDVMTLQMLAWVAAGEHHAIKDDFVALYESLDERAGRGLSAMIESWGREPIEPFTWSSISTTFTALTEGLLLRHAVDPDSVDTTMLGEIAMCLVSSMTRHTSEDVEHVRDRLDL